MAKGFNFNNLRIFKRSVKVKDLRKNRFGRIVCDDTGEICYSYKEYLRSKHWRLFKKKFKQSSSYTGCCLICSSKYKLHFHHLTYVRLGKERFSDIVVLCSKDHKMVHKALKKGILWEDILSQLEM